jgi:hypothetical protein
MKATAAQAPWRGDTNIQGDSKLKYYSKEFSGEISGAENVNKVLEDSPPFPSHGVFTLASLTVIVDFLHKGNN